jgi:hypothetical protein
MGQFCDLHQLGARLKESLAEIGFREGLKLPAEITRLKSFEEGSKVVFYKNTFRSQNRYGQYIYLPIYLIYVAAHFVDYYKELSKYFEFFKSNGLNPTIEQQCWNSEDAITDFLKDKDLDKEDYELVKSFLGDDNWWYGGKSILRSSDYFYSPILSMAGLVAASQGYVPAITKFLSTRPDLVQALHNCINDQVSMNKKLLYETKTISDFMEKSVVYLLQSDPHLNRIDNLKVNTNTIGFANCQIGKLVEVSDAVTNEKHLDDVNKEIIWSYNDKDYYFFKEQTKDSVAIFIEEMNKAYLGEFSLDFDGEKYRLYKIIKTMKPEQRIYFGAPGSGKSKKVERDVLPDDDKYVFRTTFHPDTDYSSFAGCYKPVMEGGKINYEFSPQVFTDAYIAAWNGLEKCEKYYLVIEEINRGNCAQIFGDLFQLLDRDKDTGYSEYAIKADKDLRDYLEKEGDNAVLKNKDGIKNGKLKLPPNLNIIATMNTSDQSLFPMDSAFKRRWNWEYVPINYEEEYSSTFTLKIDNSPFKKWVDFLKKINKIILEKTDSEDKQMGNFFIKGDVDAEDFKNKVMFYLWSEICKDLYQTNDNFFRAEIDDNKQVEFSFNQLFEDGGDKYLIGFLKYIQNYKLKGEKGVE